MLCAWMRAVIPISSRYSLRPRGSSDRECVPRIESIPTRMFCPLPTCQAKHFPSHESVCMKPFQITEAPRTVNFFSLSHDTTDWFFKYLLIKTWCHRLFPCRTIQIFFNLKAVLNQWRFLIPQPPFSFGHERCIQFVKWYLCFSPGSPIKNANVNLLSFSKTETGIGARASQ